MTWTLKDWADLAQITLFPTILLSLIGFWFTLNDARKRAIESHKTELERRRMEVETRNEQWQKVVIYSTLDAKPLGLTEIRDRFVTMATQYGLAELGIDRISDISIRAALLDLIAHNAVLRLPPIPPETADRYGATRQVDPLKDFEQRGLLRSKQLNDVCTIIEHHDRKFTENDLANFVRTSTNLGDGVINYLPSIIAALEVQNRVGRDQDRRLYRVVRTPPLPPSPTAPPPST